MKKMIDLYNKLSYMPRQLLEVQERVASIYYRTIEEKRPAPAFVVVFIQAYRVMRDEDGSYIKLKDRVTLSVQGYAPNVFRFQPQIPIADPEVMIICDMSKVHIRQIKMCNIDVCPSYDAAPLAYMKGIVEPCNRITIDVAVR